MKKLIMKIKKLLIYVRYGAYYEWTIEEMAQSLQTYHEIMKEHDLMDEFWKRRGPQPVYKG